MHEYAFICVPPFVALISPLMTQAVLQLVWHGLLLVVKTALTVLQHTILAPLYITRILRSSSTLEAAVILLLLVAAFQSAHAHVRSRPLSRHEIKSIYEIN